MDEAVLDLTAGLIARLGPEATSAQRVADAAGMSKASVFSRFGSMANLRQEAVRQCVAIGRAASLSVEDLPAGADREEAAIVALLDAGLRRPGFLALSIASMTVREPGELRDLAELGDILLRMFDLEVPAGRNDPGRLLNAIGAVGVVAVLGLAHGEYTDAATARPVIVTSALGALRAG